MDFLLEKLVGFLYEMKSTIYLFYCGLMGPIMRRGFFLTGYLMGDFLQYDLRAYYFFSWYFLRDSYTYARFCYSVAFTLTTPRQSLHTLNRQWISSRLHYLMSLTSSGKLSLELRKYFEKASIENCFLTWVLAVWYGEWSMSFSKVGIIKSLYWNLKSIFILIIDIGI